MDVPEDKLKVFISYSSLDRSSAFAIRDLLEQHGCDVWLDFFDITPGNILDRELITNVEKADVLCLLLSPTSVASKWVQRESEFALRQQGRGLRMIPIILRPCQIPDILDNILCIDARREFTSELVNLHIVRAVLGKEAVNEAELLTAGRRAELAKRELQENADQRFPKLAQELDRIRSLPIREITLSIDAKRFPVDQPTILELQLTLNPLWTQPMSFYFALYREGATWPEEFNFREPAYTDYFKARRSRVDCKFQWFDRIEELNANIDGTDFHDLPATFTLSFDGADFRPGGKGLHLPQKFEIPPLQTLIDDKCKFSLIAHYPQTKTAEVIDLQLTDIDIVVRARFKDSQPALCRLFHSRIRKNEKAILGCNYLSVVKNEIERDALLGLYPVPSEDPDPDRKRRIVEAIQSDQQPEEQDRRMAAWFCLSEALLASVRNDHFRALKLFEKVAYLMEPVVFEKYPTYEEGILLYRACENLVGYFLMQKNFRRAADFVNSVGVVAQRLVTVDPDEPDYWRLWADALLKNAIVHAENGDKVKAAGELSESLKTWQKLYSELPSRERLMDVRKAFAVAVDYAKSWDIESLVPLEAWRGQIDSSGSIETAVSEKMQQRSRIPVWLEPADPNGWPTVPFESPLLRYSLRIPKRWSTTPQLSQTTMEAQHIFRGPWPTELLIVSFMDKASPGGKMADWVEGILAVTGFPVLEMIPEAGSQPRPTLIEWVYEGALRPIAEKLDADEAHCYTGIAQLPGKPPRLSRLYILLVRRATFAWKVTLAFETACLPGMPDEIVVSNDHVRAGAVLGSLHLG